MFRLAVFLVACICATAMAAPYGASAPALASGYAAPALASGYGAPALASGYGSGAPVNILAPAAAPAQQIINLQSNAEAQAAALTNAAGAKASAAKINAVQWRALNDYGWHIGVPLLTKPYGPLTSLYSAALPPRSFVGKIDPAFLKDSYGKIKFVGESSIGVAAI